MTKAVFVEIRREGASPSPDTFQRTVVRYDGEDIKVFVSRKFWMFVEGIIALFLSLTP